VRWSSTHGAGRAQPAATGREAIRPENRTNKPVRNRWQPPATVQDLMVRRGRRFESVRGLCKDAARRRFLAFSFSSTCSFSRLTASGMQGECASSHRAFASTKNQRHTGALFS
jgi:hypothetical protein